MSNVGKSVITAALCRIFRQDGFRSAPFKSQNMSLNSFITEDGLEISRMQAVQAEAAGIKPDVRMNPILLKPFNDKGSLIIVNGKAVGSMSSREYFNYKTSLVSKIIESFHSLANEYDIIVIEGAGSPVELNLKQNDLVNMGLAAMVDSPVLLVGDIDRGGIFAQLLGTLMLLEPEERFRVKGQIINKFRGDKTLFKPGLDMLYDRSGIPVTGVIPYGNFVIEAEDSLSEKINIRNKADADNEKEYDFLSDLVRKNINMNDIYKIIGIKT
jgi:adenosylcobyric acid synthase